MVHVSEPYSSMDSTVAWNSLILRSLRRSDFHIFFILWQAAQAFALRTLKSCSVLAIHAPRYTKSSTFSMSSPLMECMAGCSTSWMFMGMYLVFDSFIRSPTILAAASRLSRRDCASFMVLVIRATSSANSVSAIFSALTRLLRAGLIVNPGN